MAAAGPASPKTPAQPQPWAPGVENHPDYDPARWWFGEDQGRYLITVPDVAAFQAQLAKGTRNEDTAASGVRRLGTTGGDSVFGVKLDALRQAHLSFFKEWMEG